MESRDDPQAGVWHQGTGAETMEVLFMPCSASFPIQHREDHLPRGGPAHSNLGHPTSNLNQENAPQTHLQANLMDGSSSSPEAPSSQVPLVCVKLVKTNQE